MKSLKEKSISERRKKLLSTDNDLYVLHRLPILERLNKTCLYFVLILTAVE